MLESNIVASSNIFNISTEDPRWDSDFVKQLIDYDRLMSVKNRYETDSRIKALSEKQMAITNTETRCVYAKSDPCWGYIKDKGVISYCINGDCPNIFKCNPTYTLEQAISWIMPEKVRQNYGQPEKQKKYYLVDLVAGEETTKYISHFKEHGIEYPIVKDYSPIETEKKPKDRQLVIIGYEETYFGDADNQLSPIWGYVNETGKSDITIINRYGSRTEHIHSNAIKAENSYDISQKSNKIREPNKNVVTNKNKESLKSAEPSIIKKTDYEKTVKGKIVNRYNLTEINYDILQSLADENVMNIILSNKAEMSYVSSMLLQMEIAHDIESLNGNENICLWNSDAKSLKFKSSTAMVSSAFISHGCDAKSEYIWAKLNEISSVNQIEVSGRDFFDFEDENGYERWGCRNLYGATHLVVTIGDLDLSHEVEYEQKITLMKDTSNYIILLTSSAEQIGVTTESFWSALKSLKNSDEISEFPRIVSGLVLKVTMNGFIIKGIGHMKFDEY